MGDSQQSQENFTECHTAAAYGWLSPRISFSTDFGHLDKGSPRREESGAHIEWSTEFEFSLSIDFPGGAPADEIFYDGKLLPLQVVPRIHLMKELLEEESGATSPADRSCESSVCPSPLISKSASYPPAGCGSPSKLAPTCSSTWKEIFGLRKSKSKYRGVHSFKFVRLLFFRRHSGELGKAAEDHSAPTKSPVSLDSSPAESFDDSRPGQNSTLDGSNSMEGSSQLKGNSSNSGRILWKNLERCSEQSRNPSRKQAGDKGGSGSFSSNVRVAPVLNVPMCMGPVRETKSTMAGLRKLLSGGKRGGGNLQRVTWACPGGAI